MSDYEPTDSESDYDQNEKILLENVRKKYQRESSDESEQEVFNVGVVDDESDEDLGVADSDIEDNDDDGLPNEKAWGADKRKYYATDYVDPDFQGFNEKDMQMAEFEEQEAVKLQQGLTQQVVEDFLLPSKLEEVKEKDDDKGKDKTKKGSNLLNEEDKIQLLKKDSPEFFALVNDFKGRIDVYEKFLEPTLLKYKSGNIATCQAIDFLQTFTDIILNYLVNIKMYMLLKSEQIPIINHPIMKRLNEYRQLLGRLDPIFQELKPKVEELLKEGEKELVVKESEPKKDKKRPKLLDKIQIKGTVIKEKKKVKINEDMNIEHEEKGIQNAPMEEAADNAEENKLERRAITYQIAKNKGLTPRRKKEQRNPRVKHRNQFRKAKIRRKGAVREVRNEISRYGGEISGIKATVRKSIKIK